MRTVYLLTLFCWSSTSCWSQNYPIGHRTINYTDSARSNRPVPSELYYPATVAGENTTPATGFFPVIVFGHGFQMGFDSYAYLKDLFVADGYIMVFPKTETSLAPNHAEYGADLAFLVVKMKSEGSNPVSPFFQHIDSTSAIMGHSMGGGASFLGCKNNTTPTAMVTLAAAETIPSAISAARDITIPSLVFSAGLDCVTPPALNQIPMYDSLGSDCKIYISIKGGGHCYFADANFLCSMGEFGCPSFTISREQQHATILDFTKLYLDHYLKNQSASWAIFNDSLNNSLRITFQKSCATTSVYPDFNDIPVRSFPNPSGDMTCLDGRCVINENVVVKISDVAGRNISKFILRPEENHYHLDINMRSWASGIYFAEIRSSLSTRLVKIVKN
jgi:alpha-beta hydrolase superfamily lysophospholipase